MQLSLVHKRLRSIAARVRGGPQPSVVSPRCDARRGRRLVIAAALAYGSVLGRAHAGYVSQPEYELDQIFSQSSFGEQPVDVRFNAGETLYSSALASVDSSSDLGALFARATVPGTIYAFYVDAVNWCGSYSTSIIGCGALPGNAIVVDSDWAASSHGATLIAHESGHNLGLDHASSSGNLMYGTLTGANDLSAAQASTILASPLVQWLEGLPSLSITPIAVVASGAAYEGATTRRVGGANGVPEPATPALLALALGLAACLRRRQHTASGPGSVN